MPYHTRVLCFRALDRVATVTEARIARIARASAKKGKGWEQLCDPEKQGQCPKLPVQRHTGSRVEGGNCFTQTAQERPRAQVAWLPDSRGGERRES